MLSGVLLIDKPIGVSSAAALNRAKRTLGIKKLGHTGTLDPFASGLLVALCGSATRIADLLHATRKEYIAEITFGAETDTLDPEGTIVARAPLPALEALMCALPHFIGTLLQQPPAYSALKVAGKRAYQVAREGGTPELSARDVQVFELELLETGGSAHAVQTARCRIVCGAGTYIRSLARDIGAALGSRAHLTALRRTGVGPFRVEDSVAPDAVRTESMMPIVAACRSLPVCALIGVSETVATAIRFGKPLQHDWLNGWVDQPFALATDAADQPCALLERSPDGRPRYRAVFRGAEGHATD